jgi:hypothetical protein
VTWFEWVMLAFLAVLYVVSALPRRCTEDGAEARRSHRQEKASSALPH